MWDALADFALDVLPDHGVLLAMIDLASVGMAMRALDKPGLVYRSMVAWRFHDQPKGGAPCGQDWTSRMFTTWKPVLVFPDAPPSLVRSQEVDVYPRSEPERAQEIDGAIGDGSMFNSTYGYYAHGVGPETISAPAGWEARLERLELTAIRKKDGTVVAWYLEVHDLVLAKLAAGRRHDLTFAEDAIREGLADVGRLRRGVDLVPQNVRGLVGVRLEGLLARMEKPR